MAQEIRVGCSGFQKSQAEYFQHFQLVEIQQTFYKPPQVKTALRWRETAPAGFEFTLKAWQVITHEPYSLTYRRSGLTIPQADWRLYGSFRPSGVVMMAWEKTREIAATLDASVILFQCPPQFTPTEEHIHNFRSFFEKIDHGNFRLAWEPRGEWPEDVIRDLCNEYGLIHAVDPFLNRAMAGDIRYYRLHGGADYQHRYSLEEVRRLRELFGEGEKGYVLFNNASMWENGLEFKEQIER
jgi:uncharacterized protein YecE (DUF72 family)